MYAFAGTGAPTPRAARWVRGLVLAGLLSQSAPADDDEIVLEVTRPAAPYRRLELTLEQPLRCGLGGHDRHSAGLDLEGRATVYLHARGDRVTDGWIRFSVKPFTADALDTGGLALAPERLSGNVKSPELDGNLDVRLDGAELKGTLKGTYRKEAFESAVTGVARTLEQQRALHALAPGKDWPCLRGPFFNGAAHDCDRPLVTSLDDVRLVWRAERRMPGGYERLQAGYNPPVVYGGKAYLLFWEPGGDVVDQENVKWWEARKGGKGSVNARGAILKSTVGADDIVVCLDAATGALLWEARFNNSAMNVHNWSVRGSPASKKAHQCLPHVVDGRLYGMGVLGLVFCLDAETGAEIWRSDVGAFYDKMRAWRREQLRKRTMRGIDVTSFTVSPAVIDGVLVCPAGYPTVRSNPSTIMGLDAATGKPLWTSEVKVSSGSSPIPWSCDGKTYVIADTTCLEPRTGRVVWTAPRAVHTDTKEPGGVTVWNDYLVTSGSMRADDRQAHQCFRLSPAGAKKLWDAPPDRFNSAFKSGTVCKGVFYAWVLGGSTSWGQRGIDIATGEVVADHVNGHYRSAACQSLVSSNDRIIYERIRMTDVSDPRQPRILRSMLWLGATELKPAPWSAATQAVVADGRLFVRGGGSAVCYDLRQPAEPEQRALDAVRGALLARLVEMTKGPDVSRAMALLARLRGMEGIAAAMAGAEQMFVAEMDTAFAAGNTEVLDVLLGFIREGQDVYRPRFQALARRVLAGEKAGLFRYMLETAGQLGLPVQEVDRALLEVYDRPRSVAWTEAAAFSLRARPETHRRIVQRLCDIAARGSNDEDAQEAALILAGVCAAEGAPARDQAIEVARKLLKTMVMFRIRLPESKEALQAVTPGRGAGGASMEIPDIDLDL